MAEKSGHDPPLCDESGTEYGGVRNERAREEGVLDLVRCDGRADKVRAVEINDPNLRALFEIYAALVLDTTEYNSFETH